ncbi:MAG: mercury(II) reductase [Candidatus Didemnitutus sp.]|nr:mercury(II) reductase [Candidatus Didemnitutus sp.]
MSDCCSTNRTENSTATVPEARCTRADGKHLLIVGGGGAAFAAALKASGLGARATIINDGLPMGGTCVNVGCVPSKTLLRAAETLHRAQSPAPFAGIATTGRLTDFAAVVRQKRELVEALRQAKYADVIGDDPRIQFVRGRGRLIDARTVEVNGERLRGDAVLLCTGARPAAPDIPGLADVPFLTNESAFELTELPESLLVLGGRYIALECAQLFSRLGTRVTVLQRSARILPTESPALTDELTAHLKAEGLGVVTGVAVNRVSKDGTDVVVEAVVNGQREVIRASRVLVATGRTPNADGLGLDQVGVQVDASGFIQADAHLQTAVPGIYAAGDVIGEPMFVYTAAYEGALAAENALTDAARPRDYAALPWVVFTDPQVAGVGLDLAQAEAAGLAAEASTLPLSQVPRSLAARDTRGFIQLIRDRETDCLLGARILAPEGGELLMEAALAIRHGITVRELASAFHPYLTLSEGIKVAALSFGKDVNKLSCCAA